MRMAGLDASLGKALAGLAAGIIAAFMQHLLPLFIAVVAFIFFDFMTGIWKSYALAKRRKEKFAFESVKAWRTIYKTVFILLGIVLAESLDATIAADGRLRLANYFCGFACGVEFWSFLENAAVISEHPVFKWLRKFMKGRVEDGLGVDFDDIKKAKEETDKKESS